MTNQSTPEAIAQRQSTLRELATDTALIQPSMLNCDFLKLGEELSQIQTDGARCLHLDVMDGHFVPNLSYGLTLTEEIRRGTPLPLDAHLMISNPADYATKYVAAGADSVTVHIEVLEDPTTVLKSIRDSGARAGLALNPPTPLDSVLPYLEYCDLVLVMSVMPGFGGQAFDPVALEKIAKLKQQAPDSLVIQVDGGVNDATIASCHAAGANWFVVGSAIFKHEDYAARIRTLHALAIGN